MEFRKAVSSDFEAVMQVFQAAIRHMDETEIHQWDKIYPSADDIKADIFRDEMFLGLLGGSIASVFTLNREQDEQYANGRWEYGGERYAVVHRLCVDPARQGTGIGTQTMKYAEETLKSAGCEDFRLDAFSQNPAALRLYGKLGFRKVGEARFRKGMFYLFEKRLQSPSPFFSEKPTNPGRQIKTG